MEISKANICSQISCHHGLSWPAPLCSLEQPLEVRGPGEDGGGHENTSEKTAEEKAK